MKIVSRAEFLKMPKGTVFCKFPRFDETTRSYGEYLFGIDEPNIKITDGSKANDFFYIGLGTSLEPKDCRSCSDFFDTLEDMEAHLGKDVPFEYSIDRDGLYEDVKKVGFAIFSRSDVFAIINALQEALKTGYK
jgi:hypothetical protein